MIAVSTAFSQTVETVDLAVAERQITWLKQGVNKRGE
jgi:hypothetical protein